MHFRYDRDRRGIFQNFRRYDSRILQVLADWSFSQKSYPDIRFLLGSYPLTCLAEDPTWDMDVMFFVVVPKHYGFPWWGNLTHT